MNYKRQVLGIVYCFHRFLIQVSLFPFSLFLVIIFLFNFLILSNGIRAKNIQAQHWKISLVNQTYRDVVAGSPSIHALDDVLVQKVSAQIPIDVLAQRLSSSPPGMICFLVKLDEHNYTIWRD